MSEQEVFKAAVRAKIALGRLYSLGFDTKELSGESFRFVNKSTETVLAKMREIEYEVHNIICTLEFEIVNSEDE